MKIIMKKKTLKTIKHMLMLMKRKKAHFFRDEKGNVYWTYPKSGWINPPTIDGVELEYVGKHDDTDYDLMPVPTDFSKIIMSKIRSV